MKKAGKLIKLYLLWIICSVPIITIGASTTAMFYVSMKEKRGEEVNVSEDFYKSFRLNFKQATLLWVIIAAVGTAVFAILFKAFSIDGNFSRLAEVLSAVLTLFYVIAILYVFPILARYDNTILKTVRFSIAVASVNFGSTAAFVVLLAAEAVTIYMLPALAILWVLIGNPLIANYMSKTCVEIFASAAKKEDSQE